MSWWDWIQFAAIKTATFASGGALMVVRIASTLVCVAHLMYLIVRGILRFLQIQRALDKMHFIGRPDHYSRFHC